MSDFAPPLLGCELPKKTHEQELVELRSVKLHFLEYDVDEDSNIGGVKILITVFIQNSGKLEITV